ncbi:MAG: glycosyltransferase family 4 protein [Gammaproteobacteria bacterium]|nr:glycosyltransferase family 4 protein [Gammaproteobacteria bacterium]
MKLLLTHKFFKLTGGAEVFFFETGRLLEEHGHEVVYFSTSTSDNRPSPYEKYFIDPPEYSDGNILRRAFNIKRMIYSLKAKEKFARLLDDTKPDLVHAFAIHVHLTPSILVAAYEADVPVVMSCNDYKHICPNYKLYHHGHICTDCRGKRFYKAIVNRCCKDSLAFSIASSLEAYSHNAMNIYSKYVDMYLFSSEFMARETENFWGVGSFCWDMLRNPFESRKYPYSPDYEDYGLYFGRLIDEKGVDILVSAAALAPTVRLKIVGNGPDAGKLKALANSLGLNNIEFVGSLWGTALDDILKRTRFVVVPSVWHENFPYVINQSFAFGKAVIGTDRGGIPELVKHGERGIVYPAHDIRLLADAMLDLWNNSEKAVEMGRRAKEYSDSEFNDEQQYEKLMSIYKKVLDARTSSGR